MSQQSDSSNSRITEPDYYDVLGVHRNATAEEIRQAYYERSRLCHPDRVEGRQAEFHLVNEANQVLADPELRQIFDENGAKAVLFFLEVVEGMSDHQRHIGRMLLGQFLGETESMDSGHQQQQQLSSSPRQENQQHRSGGGGGGQTTMPPSSSLPQQQRGAVSGSGIPMSREQQHQQQGGGPSHEAHSTDYHDLGSSSGGAGRPGYF